MEAKSAFKNFFNTLKILQLVKFNPEKGKIEFPSGRIAFLGEDILTLFQSELEKIVGENYRVLAYTIGKKLGLNFWKCLEKNFNGKTPEEKIKLACKFVTYSGWGKHEVFLTKNQCTIRVYNSIISNSYKNKHFNSDKPTCHLHCGLLVKLVENAFGWEAEGKETKCASVESKYCEFIIFRKKLI